MKSGKNCCFKCFKKQNPHSHAHIIFLGWFMAFIEPTHPILNTSLTGLASYFHLNFLIWILRIHDFRIDNMFSQQFMLSAIYHPNILFPIKTACHKIPHWGNLEIVDIHSMNYLPAGHQIVRYRDGMSDLCTVKWGNLGRWGNFGQYKTFILSNIFCHLKNNLVVNVEVKGYLLSVICFKRSFIRLDPMIS